MSKPEEKQPTYLTRRDQQLQILRGYSAEQQLEIISRLSVLTTIALSIGKDPSIIVELNSPRGGWLWNFKDNIIKVDPENLLSKSINYQRFVMAHEGGHRRISRVAHIPLELWRQTGFSFMMNAIEDPRTNSFLMDNYPIIGDYMIEAYSEDFASDLRQEFLASLDISIDEAKNQLGYVPRFIMAGFEYLFQWFLEISTGNEYANLRSDLPEDVKAVVSKTLKAARHSWRHYPSIEEVESEDLVEAYAYASYEINRDQVWPEFKKLVEQDKEDQQIQELLKELQKNFDNNSETIPNNLRDQLNENEQNELRTTLEQNQAQDAGKENHNTTSHTKVYAISDELKQKLKEHIDTLPEEQKADLIDKADNALRVFEAALNEKLSGKFVEDPTPSIQPEATKMNPNNGDSSGISYELSSEEQAAMALFQQRLKELADFDANLYEKYLREVSDIIDRLEFRLIEIFTARRESELETGLKSGKKLNLRKVIQERARNTHPLESRAWENVKLPDESSYAISILVDLSGSMNGPKITETFKALIVLAEVLNRLAIKFEILAFNEFFYEYKTFDQTLNDSLRQKLSEMPEKTSATGADFNNDGWALQQSSERLSAENEEYKFLIVLSDGSPAPSGDYCSREFELSTVIKNIITNTQNKLIGLGIGAGTEHVAKYYPYSIANIKIDELADVLADLVLEMIENYQEFK